MKFAIALLCLSSSLMVQGLPNLEERVQSDSSPSSNSDTRESVPVEEQQTVDEKILPIPLNTKLPIIAGAISSVINPQPSIILPPSPPNPPVVVVPPPNPPPTQPPIVVRPPSQPTSCGSMNSQFSMPCYSFSTGCKCISQTPAAWRTAFDTCAAGGKRLVSIDSLSKAIDFQSNLQLVVGVNTPLVVQGWWTSGLYSVQMNNFVWASLGTPFSFTNWAAGSPLAPTEPPNPNGICVHVAANSLTSQFWNEQSCNAAFPFICE